MGGRLLAVGDEEGIVTILNTSRPMPDQLSRGKANAQWLGHQNAIFGLQWYQARVIVQLSLVINIDCYYS